MKLIRNSDVKNRKIKLVCKLVQTITQISHNLHTAVALKMFQLEGAEELLDSLSPKNWTRGFNAVRQRHFKVNANQNANRFFLKQW